MSMTREEVNKRLKGLRMRCQRLLVSSRRNPEEWRKDIAALDLALSALRPVSREQAEKAWKGDWKFEPDIYDCGTYVCSKCGEPWTLIDGTPAENNMNFCPNCGAAMTDEAVKMVMERLEALHHE